MKGKRPVTKAVIAAAGYGTRFLPATKNQPKEMLPIIDKPIIHYLVEECVKSGITDIILVTRAGQHIMEDYFDNNYELEYSLEQNGKENRLKIIKDIPQMANFVYVRQKGHLPYGNGSPLVAAAPLIDDDEAFAYLFGDDMVLSKTPCIQQLKEVYENNDCDGVIAAQTIPREETYRYGIVKFKEGTNQFEALVEKPDPEDAPSTVAEFGRFILNNKTVSEILKKNTGLDGELWLVDAITRASENGGTFLVHDIEGKWMTTGDPLRYMKTMVEFALEREDLGQEFKDYLKNLEM
ncbi:NTP transferase domain-containing protein [candidate division WWE3 bacterium]|uniref:UTP--glucose-1-phosphate uridylyltransferase n=1 Tax=candidate division WWE3 bacterium TaxID=2053526 RepID=A0A955RNZ4_UNCKA|nr:NTP transferase domain-containing protein [candidate division WWE3 bacterium]